MLHATVSAVCVALTLSASLGDLLSTSKEEKSQAAVKGRTKASREGRSPDMEGVHLAVRVPKAVVAGLPLLIKAEVVNQGKNPIYINWSTTDPLMAQIKLATKGGKPVPFTAYGQKMIAPTERLDILNKACGSCRGWQVFPGKASELNVPNLALFYDLTLPGEYVLFVEKVIDLDDKPGNKQRKLHIDKISFTIKQP